MTALLAPSGVKFTVTILLNGPKRSITFAAPALTERMRARASPLLSVMAYVLRLTATGSTTSSALSDLKSINA